MHQGFSEWLPFSINAAAKRWVWLKQDTEAVLRTERADFAAREQHFEKELAAAQKLAALHKGNSEKRSSEAAELSGLVRDLRTHIQVTQPTLKPRLDKKNPEQAQACDSCITPDRNHPSAGLATRVHDSLLQVLCFVCSDWLVVVESIPGRIEGSRIG